MSEICPKCETLYCDCEAIAERKEVESQSRQISDVRTREISQLLVDVKRGDISHKEAKRLYDDLHEKIKDELALMKELSARIIPSKEEKVKSFADFPLK